MTVMTGYTGLDALKEAIFEARVGAMLYVPGYPVTEAAKALGTAAQMATNEKVALEVALGASATGKRALVLVKHLGVNILSDPLSISPTHTIGAGLVVMVGEDIGPRGSQVELDVRHYGPLCEIPVLDPSGPASLHSAILEAYSLSERIEAPVMVRVTFDFGKAAEGGRDLGPVETASPDIAKADVARADVAEVKRFDRSIWDLTAKGRHQRYRRDVLPLMAESSERTHLNRLRRGDGDVGIVASGSAADLAADLDVPLLAAGYAHPLPWDMIREFLKERRKVLVAEEPAPFIESQLRMSEKVCGRFTGHLPWGRLEASDLVLAVEKIDSSPRLERPLERAEGRGTRDVCEDCLYRPLYEAVRDLNVPVAGDAGCSIRAVRPPLEAVDAVYGLGSSVGVASGFEGKGVAIIGDYALAHTGLQGLMDALNSGRDVLVILLQNRVAAMTGGQAVPDMTPVLEAIVPGIRKLEMPTSRGEIRSVLEEELGRQGVSLVVATGTCPRYTTD